MIMDGDAQFARFFDILARRSRMVVAIGLCGTMAIGLLAWSLPTKYTAKAEVVIEDSRGVPVNAGGLIRDAGADQATILTEVTALKSDDLLKNVFLQLKSDPAFQAIHAKPKQPSSEAEHDAEIPGGPPTSGLFDTAILRRWINEIESLRLPLSWGSPDAVPAAPGGLTMEALRQRLNVYQELGSHVISVTYTSTNADEAALVVNKIVSYYVDEGDAQRHASLNRSVLGLETKISDLKTEMGVLETLAAAYQTARGLNDGAKANLVDQKLGDLNHQLLVAQTDLAARSAPRVSLLALRGNASDWGHFLLQLNAAGLVDLHSQIMALLQSRQTSIVVARTADREPGGAEQVENRPLRARLAMLLDQALQKLTDDQNVAEARVTAIKERLDAVQSVSDDRHLNELVTAAAGVRHRYERLLQRRDELIEQRDGLSPMVGLLSRASPPDRPSSHNPLLFVPPGAIASVVFGCMVALIRDRMERTLRSESDVRAILGIRCAGMVPRLPRGGASRHPLSVPMAAYSEAIRSIMVSLQLSWPRRQASRVILITSSVPEEGKSTLATSLASYATRAGARVLLLDLDIGGLAATGDHLDQPNGTLGELLERDRIPLDTIRTADGTEFDYLPVRRGLAGDPLPLFSPDLVSDFLGRLRSGYDYIIVDSAPVLVVAEARFMAALADRILFVVRWGKTGRNEARRALELLRQARGADTETRNLISAVITRVDLKKHARRRHNDEAEALAKYSGYYITQRTL
jgi:uncharacterized protein involved in exopolysaccharide biosynthesis/Mrp family chromosome partitioning ATPase